MVSRTAKFSSLIAASALVLCGASFAHAASLREVIRETQPKMVKIYGAGGVRGLEAYQSGFLVSAQGHVVTTNSHVLLSETITVTLNDGRKFDAQQLGADPVLGVAVLKIEAGDLPFFDLKQAATAVEGTRVLAFSNLFGVATGDESVSVLHGSVSAITTLAARRGVFDSPYQGPVYVLDAMTNNPGATGGALTDVRGKLLGMLGQELRSTASNIWLNYAIPANELVEAVEQIKAGKARPAAGAAAKRARNPLTSADLGLIMVPDVLERTPPFVDSIRPGSAAANAGVQPDDLVVFVDDQIVQSCNLLASELGRLERDAKVRVVLLRSGQLVNVTLQSNGK
jgi:serine protease Do